MSDLNCHEDTIQWPSIWIGPWAYPQCALFPFNKHLIVSILSVFVEILYCKAEGQALVTDHRSSGQDLVLSLQQHSPAFGWEPRPRSKLLQTKATQDHPQNYKTFSLEKRYSGASCLCLRGRLRAQDVQEDMGASFSWRTELLQVLSDWEVLFIFKWNNQGGNWKLLLLVLLFEDRTAVTNSGSEKVWHALPLTHLLSKGDPGAAHPGASRGQGGEIFRQPAKLDFQHRACCWACSNAPQEQRLQLTSENHTLKAQGPPCPRSPARQDWGKTALGSWARQRVSRGHLQTQHTH